ncbi:PmbA protein [Methanolinea mesophila]|uniref:TldD/PmbA family protein n=1 Tax=Methanolinea mesophila TaxID=547055 RepID=UPI0031587BD8|nr:PmbA protein [Methanolinea mesophila]
MDDPEKILKYGSGKADETEVYYARGRTISADLKRDKVSAAVESQSAVLTVRVILQGKIGTSSTNDPGRWKDCFHAALDGAHLVSAQPWKGLPDPVLGDPAPLAFDPDLPMDPQTVQDLLGELKAGAASYKDVEITSGSAELSTGEILLMNSSGITYRRPVTSVGVSLETIREQSTGYEFDHSVYFDIDAGSVGEKAAELAHRSHGGKDIPSGEYEVVLSPIALAQVLGAVVVPALNGRNVNAGRSRLAGHLGEQIADSSLNLLDDPFRPRAPGSTRWDAEGVPTEPVHFIRDGILESFCYDLKTAYRYDTRSTGSAVRGGPGGAPSIGHHNLVLDGPRGPLLEDSVLYIRDVVGAHTANPMSGDFSVELSNPFMAKDGDFELPVRKAMLSGNAFDMLNDVVRISPETRSVGSMILPSIRLKNQKIIVN